MQTIITTIPDYKVHEYLLVLSPTGEACQRIWSLKHDLRRTLNAPFATQTGPHLTMIVFLAYHGREGKIVHRLKMISSGITPFNVALQNLGCFNASKTIYVNVVTKDPILNVLEELKQARHLLKLNVGFPPKVTYNPHVSLCRGMEDWQYTVGWSKYSTLLFNTNFTAKSMTLLKRVPDEHTCKLVGQFPFLGTPTMPIQARLFD